MKKTLVAVFDSRGRYIGTKLKAKPAPDDFLLPNGCDLPTDGSYKRAGKEFVPLGHGIGKPKRPPISTEAVLFEMIRALTDLAPDAVPTNVRKWANWYQQYQDECEGEIKEARKLRAARGR